MNEMHHLKKMCVQTFSPPHLTAIFCAVSKARCWSEEYIAEMFGSLDSLLATFIIKYTETKKLVNDQVLV